MALRPPPFQTRGEISPGKNVILPRTTAGSMQLLVDYKSFAVMCLLALIGRASYPVLVHRLTVSVRASFPRSVTLTQLHFLSLAVASSREDFHLQDHTHAGHTHLARSLALRSTWRRDVSERCSWPVLLSIRCGYLQALTRKICGVSIVAVRSSGHSVGYRRQIS